MDRHDGTDNQGRKGLAYDWHFARDHCLKYGPQGVVHLHERSDGTSATDLEDVRVEEAPWA